MALSYADQARAMNLSFSYFNADSFQQDITGIMSDGLYLPEHKGVVNVNFGRFWGRFACIKMTWNSGLSGLQNGDLIRMFSMFPQDGFPDGNQVVCLPYITENAVHQTSSNYLLTDWIDGALPGNNWTEWSMTSAFRAALADLGGGKFSVRIAGLPGGSPQSRCLARETIGNLSGGGGPLVVEKTALMAAEGDMGGIERIIRSVDPGTFAGSSTFSATKRVIRKFDPGTFAGSSTTSTTKRVIRSFNPGTFAGTSTTTTIKRVIRGSEVTMASRSTVDTSVEIIAQQLVFPPITSLDSASALNAAKRVIRKFDPGTFAGTSTVAATKRIIFKIDPGTFAGRSTLASTKRVTRKEDPGTFAGSSTLAATASIPGIGTIDKAETYVLEGALASVMIISDGTEYWVVD